MRLKTFVPPNVHRTVIYSMVASSSPYGCEQDYLSSDGLVEEEGHERVGGARGALDERHVRERLQQVVRATLAARACQRRSTAVCASETGLRSGGTELNKTEQN